MTFECLEMPATATCPTLGAHSVGPGVVVFAVWSKNATRMVLEIFERAMGQHAVFSCTMARHPGTHVWCACVRGVPQGALYGLRAWGPNWPYDPAWVRGNSSAGFLQDVDAHGHRFNPNKLLFDPYARELTHDRDGPQLHAYGHSISIFATGGEVYRYEDGAHLRQVKRREFDTAPFAPKAVFLDDERFVGDRPRIPRENAIIYEAHLRGLTRHPSSMRLSRLLSPYPAFARVIDVPDEERGTYRGAARMAPYLRALGVNCIELMPIHETCNDDNPEDRVGGNFWGYATFGYFAPDRRYAFDRSLGGPTREFKAMVAAFHAEGIEVYLDVVYNHTGEGGHFRAGDPTTVAPSSLLGLDAAEYFVWNAQGLQDSQTGCGNQVRFPHPATDQLVLDSVHYWHRIMGVDGFRFDLATVVADSPEVIAKLGDYARQEAIEVIAEPWAVCSQGQGTFPHDWGEWNDQFRNTVRDFMRGLGSARTFANVVNGDVSRFRTEGDQRSINFIDAHDGFTMADLVSYNAKTNTSLQWPFGPSDGGEGHNRSSDCAQDRVLRRQRLRNFWVVLLFSRGVPMFVYGDEFARTQNGNNNPYNVDSVATWNNYAMVASNRPQCVPTEGPGEYHDNLGTTAAPPGINPLFAFASYLLRLRRDTAELRQRNYDAVCPARDAEYDFRREDGAAPLLDFCRCIWLRIRSGGRGRDFLVFFNFYSAHVPFRIPADACWERLVDTANWAEPHCNFWTSPEPMAGDYVVHPYSTVVLRSC